MSHKPKTDRRRDTMTGEVLTPDEANRQVRADRVIEAFHRLTRGLSPTEAVAVGRDVACRLMQLEPGILGKEAA
jgi:hypothetical protein